MGSSSFKKVSIGEIKGWIREELIPLLPPTFFDDPFSSVEEMGGEIIKASRIRWAAIITLSNQQRVFVKSDRTKGWTESIKYLVLPSKGRKEWFVAYQLQKRNVAIPKPWVGLKGFIAVS